MLLKKHALTERYPSYQQFNSICNHRLEQPIPTFTSFTCISSRLVSSTYTKPPLPSLPKKHTNKQYNTYIPHSGLHLPSHHHHPSPPPPIFPLILIPPLILILILLILILIYSFPAIPAIPAMPAIPTLTLTPNGGIPPPSTLSGWNTEYEIPNAMCVRVER